jgi:hypothetical protein
LEIIFHQQKLDFENLALFSGSLGGGQSLFILNDFDESASAIVDVGGSPALAT